MGNSGLTAVLFRNSVSWQKKVLTELWEIWRLLERRDIDDFEYAVSVKLVFIWHLLVSNCKGNEAPVRGDMRRRLRIQKMLLFIQESYSSQIYLEDIAAAASVSVVETMEECEEIDKVLGTEIRKSIFLCNQKKTSFLLVVMPAQKQLDSAALL